MRLPAISLMLSAMIGSYAQASTIDAQFWDITPTANMFEDALRHIDQNAPDATFLSSGIEYPNFSGLPVATDMTLQDFITPQEANTASGDLTTRLDSTVFRFTGVLDLAAGTHTFQVISDDWHRLKLGDDVVLFKDAFNPSQTSTFTAQVTGPTAFELIYVESRMLAGVTMTVDDNIVDTTTVLPAVPVPASLPLMLSGFGLFWLGRKRRASKS